MNSRILQKARKVWAVMKFSRTSPWAFMSNILWYILMPKRGYNTIICKNFSLRYKLPQQTIPLLIAMKAPNEIEFYYFQRYLSKFSLIIDIGGGIGSFCIPCIRNFYGKIYVFEPHLVNFQTLTGNIALNNAEQIIYPYNLAVSETEQKVTLNIDNSNFFLNSLSDKKSANQAVVDSIVLDDFIELNKITHINLLKIDTEGHEREVLHGCKRALNAHMLDYIIVERNRFLEEIFAILNSAGYQGYFLTPHMTLQALHSFKQYSELSGSIISSNLIFMSERL